MLSPSPVQSQPHPALPDLNTIEAWLSAACGVGRPADVAWAEAHTRVPMRRRDCGGEIRHCRTQRVTRAAPLITSLCEYSEFTEARRDGRPGWLSRLLQDAAAERFDTWRGQRRVMLGGQFLYALLFDTAPDGQARLVGWRDE